MENKNLIKEMVKLQILCARWAARHTSFQCETLGDINRLLGSGNRSVTYSEAIQNLKRNAKLYCKNSPLIDEVNKLEESINNSNIKDLRFGIERGKKFTKIEQELDSEVIDRQFFMSCEMVGIKYVVENLGLTESAVKQACQQERILNTKKLGKNWMVHIPECRAYWNIPDTDTSHLYRNWEY